MRIALIEPFYGGSHKLWADGLKRYSQHTIDIFSLSPHHWKWRMHGAAITLAKLFNAADKIFDLVVVSDFLNLPLFKSLITYNPRVILYFHENQITYPWSKTDPDLHLHRDNHYGFINYSSALVSDSIFFNSSYHFDSFFGALPDFLRQFPDHRNNDTISKIRLKSKVLSLGVDFEIFDSNEIPLNKSQEPIILWNHRWEYDKNPEEFFKVLFGLYDDGVPFKLVVLGQRGNAYPTIFDEAKQRLASRILHWGYCDTRAVYANWLWRADILPVTAYQDFFGISVVEAMYCNTYPLLPNRLAYPEHLEPPANKFLYSEPAEFVSKLRALCQRVDAIGDLRRSKIIESYDWRIMAPIYDEHFEAVIA